MSKNSCAQKHCPCPNCKAPAPEGEEKLCTEKLCEKGTVQQGSANRAKQKGWENSLRGIIAGLELSAWHSRDPHGSAAVFNVIPQKNASSLAVDT